MDKDNWSGHAPDLVRDNRLMHERVAEQDREIARLTELLRIAESKAIRQSEAHHCPTCVCPDIDIALGRPDPEEKCTCGKLWSETMKGHRPECVLKAYS